MYYLNQAYCYLITLRHKIYFLIQRSRSFFRRHAFKVKNPESVYAKKEWNYAETCSAVLSNIQVFLTDTSYEKEINNIYIKAKGNRSEVSEYFWVGVLACFPQIKKLSSKDQIKLRNRFNQEMNLIIEWNIKDENHSG
jgi:hypothetical protein